MQCHHIVQALAERQWRKNKRGWERLITSNAVKRSADDGLHKEGIIREDLEQMS